MGGGGGGAVRPSRFGIRCRCYASFSFCSFPLRLTLDWQVSSRLFVSAGCNSRPASCKSDQVTTYAGELAQSVVARSGRGVLELVRIIMHVSSRITPCKTSIISLVPAGVPVEFTDRRSLTCRVASLRNSSLLLPV